MSSVHFALGFDYRDATTARHGPPTFPLHPPCHHTTISSLTQRATSLGAGAILLADRQDVKCHSPVNPSHVFSSRPLLLLHGLREIPSPPRYNLRLQTMTDLTCAGKKSPIPGSNPSSRLQAMTTLRFSPTLVCPHPASFERTLLSKFEVIGGESESADRSTQSTRRENVPIMTPHESCGQRGLAGRPTRKLQTEHQISNVPPPPPSRQKYICLHPSTRPSNL